MFQVSGSTYGIDKKFLEKVAQAAFSFLDNKFEVNLIFVSEQRIMDLNRIYRGKNQVTDVLSFKLEENEGGGDVVICYPVAKNQAKESGFELQEEIAFLLTHGILHLAGYDHLSQAERKVMESVEDDILKKIKIGVKR